MALSSKSKTCWKGGSYHIELYYIMILFKHLYWLSCCHLTFRKILYCLIKTRIDLVSLSFSFNVIKQLQSIRVVMDLRNQYSPQPKGFGEYRF